MVRDRDYVLSRSLDELCVPSVDMFSQYPEVDTHALLADHTELTLPTAKRGIYDDSVSDVKIFRVRPNVSYSARYIGAGNVGQRNREPWDTFPY